MPDTRSMAVAGYDQIVASAVAFLRASRNPDGGWGYVPGQTSTVEPTAAATLALRSVPEADDLRSGAVTWLAAGQHAGGGWGIIHEDPDSGWQTAWAVSALALAGGPPGPVGQGVSWLLAVKPLPIRGDGLETARTKLNLDASLHGWPWQPGQADWIEPTALAMLALSLASPGRPVVMGRLAEAVRFLQDRRCRGGGWNFGNPFMLGAFFPPRAHPTAWALLALARSAPTAVLPDDLAALESELGRDQGVPAQAWGALALNALGRADGGARDRLAGRQRSDGSWDGNPYHTSIALLALRGDL